VGKSGDPHTARKNTGPGENKMRCLMERQKFRPKSLRVFLVVPKATEKKTAGKPGEEPRKGKKLWTRKRNQSGFVGEGCGLRRKVMV